MFFDTFGINYAQTQQGNRGNWPFAFPQNTSADTLVNAAAAAMRAIGYNTEFQWTVRAKGALPKDAEPGTATARRPAARSGAQNPRKRGGPNPFVVAGAAFAAGTVLAKLIDWRGHAHPRH